MKIGLIDSGLGGLAFLEGIYKCGIDYVLVMDTAFFPYGVKSKEFLIKRCLYLVDYLFKVKKVDKIILACNTISLIALDFVKTIYKNIYGVIELIPKINVSNIFLGSKNASMLYKGQTLDCSTLIEKIENKENVKEDIKDLAKNLKQYDIVILGCTHFINVKEEFKKYLNVISQDEMYILNNKEEYL